MKDRLFIFFALLVLIIFLIGLNAASFVQKDKMPDSEMIPNRSTYNSGATGARAFYDLLAETGRKVVRWQEPPTALLSRGKVRPNTFVVIGKVKREFDDEEIKQLLDWVATGGKLVIIDREPPKELISTANWNITTIEPEEFPLFNVDPSDQKQMTERTNAAKPIQPTVYTVSINAVQPSRFASSINFDRRADKIAPENKTARGDGFGSAAPAPANRTAPVEGDGDYDEDEPRLAVPTPKPVTAPDVKTVPQVAVKKTQAAPVIHLANDKKNLLADFSYGAGKIVYLADPYIVTNSGIKLVDNAQLAINIVSTSEGLVAFDEYHQGYGTNKNQLLAYFAGTPVVAIVLQLAIIIGLVFYSQSRRFARPLPEDEPNRLSKLEYVAAMAELQQRTKAFDLAIENIYTDFRRRVARSFGVDNFTTTRRDLAQMITERLPSETLSEIEDLMRKCEDISHGEPTNKKEVLELTGRLRGLEEKLGLQRRKKRRQK
ncbi:MAG TPA: DUF4350 domain-containing protein [Pyrinomonadaceae bacterium]|jgi:hypothetical protein